MKRSIVILLLLTASAALILLTLDKLMGRTNMKLNGFTRKFVERSWQKVSEFKLDKSYYSIAGFNNDNIYLQTMKAGELLVLNLPDRKVTKETISFPPIDKFEPAFHTTVIYPNVYITGSNARKMVRGNLETGEVQVFNIPTGPILSTEIIDGSNAILRCIDTLSYQIEFRKIDFVNGTSGVPVKAGEGIGEDIFAHDGSLNFDRKKGQFWYVNYYSNGIMEFNTELSNVRRHKSVDTVSRPRVSVAQMEKSITHRKPPTVVNKQSFVYGRELYIHSERLADNEVAPNPDITILDIYGPDYRGSLSVPVPSGEFMQAAFVGGNKIAALQKGRLVVFSAN
ncbi:MAG TPA: hypothetical protein VGD22_03270 [Sphingobacteriaceae bacterium]